MYDCSYCGLSMTSWGNFLDHVGTAHEGGNGVKKLECGKCHKVFLKQNNFQAHCENQNPKQCPKCHVVCCTKKQLEIHRRSVHPSFQCLMCEKYFQKKASLEKHEWIRKFKYRKPSCMLCSLSFCTTKALRLHVESTTHESKNLNLDSDVISAKDDSAMVLPSDKDFLPKNGKTCPICNKMFFNHFNVRRHLKTEHSKADRWECEECEKSFSSRYSLNYHVKACHEKDALFNCQVCEQTFDTVAKLFKHNKSSHNPELKFKCRYCEIDFNSKSNMQRHKQEVHCKGTKLDTSKAEVFLYNFSCDQCNFVSKRKFHLMRHVKNKHNKDDVKKNVSKDEKKTCPICFKMFCNSSKVRRHMLSIHEAESSNDAKDENRSSTPLSNKSNEKIKKKCYYCEKTVLRNNMWRHIEEAHNKTKYNTAFVEASAFPHGCEQCNFKTKRKDDLKRHCMHKHSLCDVTFPCERCGKVFKYEASLKRHNKTCQEKGCII